MESPVFANLCQPAGEKEEIGRAVKVKSKRGVRKKRSDQGKSREVKKKDERSDARVTVGCVTKDGGGET